MLAARAPAKELEQRRDEEQRTRAEHDGAALTAHTSIAPAVSLICAGGLALSWLSGATLVEARRLQRSSRLRTALHLAAGALAALALAYLAVTGTGLLDLLIATVRLGPEL